ncbi:MAG: NVEALA domain-containing protein [Bacteroidaceae bacterium]|nr:NVEALA domain-containing protein [Bacteroidaceae bacterium]
MRKKILGATFAIAIMAVAGYNTYVSQTKKSMSDLALANVEALAADGEGGTPCPNPYDVYGFSLKFNPRQGVFSVDIEGYSTIANKKNQGMGLGY